MVENVALNVLVCNPFLVGTETINLDRYSELSGRLLSYHHRKLLIYIRIVDEILLQIRPENP